MGRLKGSKNKVHVDPFEEKGNPEFNVTGVAPTEVLTAESVITDEDRALDRELERMANEEPPLPIDPEPVNVVAKPEKLNYQLLSKFIDDYKPASTINELLFQVDQAKEIGCDSIEATPQLIKHYCRKHYPTDVGYFMFHDIRVYIPGYFEESVKRDKRTTMDIESKTPMAMPGSRPA